MRRNRFGSSNISGILWFALGVLVLCVSATFFHVFDIERLFKNQTEDAFEGHVDTATAEIESEIDYIRGVMDNYFDNVTSIHDAELISEIILSQEKYSTGYEFYYLTKEGMLVSDEEISYEGDLLRSLQNLPSYYFDSGFICIPAKGYFPDMLAGNSFLGVQKCKTPDDETYYLIIQKDIEDTMSLGTFDYLNELGTFAIVDKDGEVIASSHSYEKYFPGKKNIFDALSSLTNEDRTAKRNLEIVKKSILTTPKDTQTFPESEGMNSLIFYGALRGSHGLYYISYFKAGLLDSLVAKGTIRSYMVCFFMMFIMVVLVVYTWISHNSSNERMVNLAYKDTVTGGYNFNFFKNTVPSIMNNQKEIPYIIMRFDILNFRYINEAYGHDKADKVLAATINEFEKYFDYSKELCVRINSDQFVALCMNDLEFEDKYSMYVKAISDVATEAGVKYPIRLKVGIYQVKKEDKDIQLMIDRANAARKSNDVSQNILIAVYSDNIIKDMRKVDAIESEMHKSLTNGEFKVFIQPKWDIIEDKVIGGEALVRWIKEDGSVVYPSDFIPIFETNGFIENLDFYMLEQLCIKMKEMRKTGNYKFYPISVNQSRVLINNPDYVNNVGKILDRYEADVSMIQLEITENVFFDQKLKMIEVVNDLKRLGLNLAMDDFGSGYSSLNILKDIPFDVLKIDKDFFDESFISKASTVILKKILEMATLLDIDVICEGVETKEQVEMLKNYGCQAVQGYFYSKPMPLEEFFDKYCRIDKH